MADTSMLVRHPLEARRTQLTELSAELDGVALELETPVAAVDLRLDPADPGPAAVADVAGGPLPAQPDTWTELVAGQALRLGPDEWLLTSTAARPEDWEFGLDEAAAEFGGTAVDVSAQRTTVRVRGASARRLLASGCAIDLRPASFPRGRCAQTLLGQAGVLLVAHGVDTRGDDDLQLFVRPSFAGYVVDWLVDAAQEFRRPT
ncbi:sarcosine oxidase subunit gamma [Actinomycetospora chibensis]|uniref:Sarcosine oxidase subunit gamma n=1 Tax=Actinomycetospora chibensis TaxID=663606 RepID=A0ABV9RC35_9PSEU|nr:sarcosine oxidase subunit gamma family protein [Actinomycetospora chibensis]MDD7926692.1 sarcosine oxidase subunit gamma family protein [Actinomycetospora chibensis]